jgi:hypothetical protein
MRLGGSVDGRLSSSERNAMDEASTAATSRMWLYRIDFTCLSRLVELLEVHRELIIP